MFTPAQIYAALAPTESAASRRLPCQPAPKTSPSERPPPRGVVVELDRKVGEAIDIYVNNRLVARGEVVIVDERLGVTMTEIIKSDRPGT